MVPQVEDRSTSQRETSVPGSNTGASAARTAPPPISILAGAIVACRRGGGTRFLLATVEVLDAGLVTRQRARARRPGFPPPGAPCAFGLRVRRFERNGLYGPLSKRSRGGGVAAASAVSACLCSSLSSCGISTAIVTMRSPEL